MQYSYKEHCFADVFDDVIEDVLARGVLGNEADGCRVRARCGRGVIIYF